MELRRVRALRNSGTAALSGDSAESPPCTVVLDVWLNSLAMAHVERSQTQPPQRVRVLWWLGGSWRRRMMERMEKVETCKITYIKRRS